MDICFRLEDVNVITLCLDAFAGETTMLRMVSKNSWCFEPRPLRSHERSAASICPYTEELL